MKSGILVFLLVTLFCASVLGVCYNDVCNRECTYKGYDGGTCKSGYCSCYKNGYSLEDIKPQELHDASDDMNRNKLEDIKPQNIQDHSEYKNQIDSEAATAQNMFSPEETIKEVPLLRRMAICYDWQCNYQCRLRGKRGGYCSIGTCYCYG